MVQLLKAEAVGLAVLVSSGVCVGMDHHAVAGHERVALVAEARQGVGENRVGQTGVVGERLLTQFFHTVANLQLLQSRTGECELAPVGHGAGDVDFLQAGASHKGSAADGGQALGQCDAGQCAVVEGPVADDLGTGGYGEITALAHGAGDQDLALRSKENAVHGLEGLVIFIHHNCFQRIAVDEAAGADAQRGQRCRNMDFGNPVAKTECGGQSRLHACGDFQNSGFARGNEEQILHIPTVQDMIHSAEGFILLRHGQLRQFGAELELAAIHLRHGSRDVDSCQAAAGEGLGSQSGNTLGQRQLRQGTQARHGSIADGGHGGGNADTRHIAAVAECVGTDGGNALLHYDGGDPGFLIHPGHSAVAVLRHGSVAGDGQHTLAADAPGQTVCADTAFDDVVVIVRCPGDGAAVILHHVRGPACQSLGIEGLSLNAIECFVAEIGCIAPEEDALQAGAAVKGSIGNRLHIGRNHKFRQKGTVPEGFVIDLHYRGRNLVCLSPGHGKASGAANEGSLVAAEQHTVAVTAEGGIACLHVDGSQFFAGIEGHTVHLLHRGGHGVGAGELSRCCQQGFQLTAVQYTVAVAAVGSVARSNLVTLQTGA